MDFTLNLIIILALAQLLLSNQIDAYEKSVFSTYRISKHQEFYRLISSAFIHSGWMHLFVNGFAIYNFSPVVVNTLGSWMAGAVFMASILGSSLVMLWKKRHLSDYQAVGASGGVSGLVMFAFYLYPDMSIGIFLIPGYLPAYVFGILFSVISIVLTYVKNPQHIAHEGHLGGLLVGGLMGMVMSDLQNVSFQSILLQQHTFWLSVLGVLPIVIWLFIPSSKTKNR